MKQIYFCFTFDPSGTNPTDFKVTVVDTQGKTILKSMAIDAKGYMALPANGTVPYTVIIKKGNTTIVTITVSDAQAKAALQEIGEENIYKVLYYRVIPEKKAFTQLEPPKEEPKTPPKQEVSHGELPIQISTIQDIYAYSNPKKQEYTYTPPKDAPPVITAPPITYSEPELTKTRQLRGRAVNKAGIALKNTSFIIYAGNRSDVGKEIEFQAIATGVTDAMGNFITNIPNKEFQAAYATLRGYTDKAIDIILEKDKLPAFTLWVAEDSSVSESSTHTQTSDCGCKDKEKGCNCHEKPNTPPRLPEMEDIMDVGSNYQQDIGGSCVNFTTPNRALEEFAYNMIVRHTDPEIMNAPGYLEDLLLKQQDLERAIANFKKPRGPQTDSASFIIYDLSKLKERTFKDYWELQAAIHEVFGMGELLNELVNPRLINIPIEKYWGLGTDPKRFLDYIINQHSNYLYSDPEAEKVYPYSSVAIRELNKLRNQNTAGLDLWAIEALIITAFSAGGDVNEPISPKLIKWTSSANDWSSFYWYDCASLMSMVLDKCIEEQVNYLSNPQTQRIPLLGRGAALPSSKVIRTLATLKKRDSLSYNDLRSVLDTLNTQLKAANSKETLSPRVKGFTQADYNNLGDNPTVLVDFLIQQQAQYLTGRSAWNEAASSTNSSATDKNNKNLLWMELELERIMSEIAYAKANVNKALSRNLLGVNNQVRWDSPLPIVQPSTISHGHLLGFRQVWRADGYSMGDLLYSLPLAPGQQKQIVIRDWERKEVASRTEEQTIEESMENALSTNRDVNEIVSAALTEQIDANSKSKNSGIGGGIGLSASGSASGTSKVGGVPVLLAGRAGLSGGFSASKGKASSEAYQKSSRNTAASTMQSVRDKVMQNASSMRSQRATVVTTMTQNESTRVTTESVANYNHCHAITVQYFEVLRHLAVYNELVNVQECLFIPLQMSLFDDAKVIRWIDLLMPALRAPQRCFNDLLRGFDAIRRYYDVRVLGKNENEIYHHIPRGRYCDEKITEINGTLRLRIHIACPPKNIQKLDTGTADVLKGITDFFKDNADGKESKRNMLNHLIIDHDADRNTWNAQLGFIREVEEIRLKVNYAEDHLRESVFQAELNRVNAYAQLSQYLELYAGNQGQQRVDTKFVLMGSGQEAANGAAKNYDFSFRTVRNAISIERDDVNLISVRVGKSNISGSATSNFELPTGSSLTVEHVHAQYRSAYINATLCDTSLSENLLMGKISIYTPLQDNEMVSPRAEDVRLRNELLNHLNTNMEYYHKAIWTQIDEDRRYMLLEGFHIEVPPRENPAYTPDNGEPQFLSEREYRSVASVVENRLISIAGNTLVMPVAKGYNLNPVFRFADDEVEIEGRKISKLMAYYMPEKGFKDTPFRISLPTKGVFAEAVQGACNSCERIDDNRFWKWEEHPIPNKPTDINPVSIESLRTSAENMTPSQLPSALISQQQGRDLPTPNGLTAAMDLLGKNNLFTDMTGLSKNQENAAAALKINTEAAQKYAEVAADLAKSIEIPKNADAYIDAVNKSGLPENDRQQLVKDYLSGKLGGAKEDKKNTNTSGYPKYGPSSTKSIREGVENGRKYKVYKDENEPNGERKVFVDSDGNSVNSGVRMTDRLGTYTYDDYGRKIYQGAGQFIDKEGNESFQSEVDQEEEEVEEKDQEESVSPLSDAEQDIVREEILGDMQSLIDDFDQRFPLKPLSDDNLTPPIA